MKKDKNMPIEPETEVTSQKALQQKYQYISTNKKVRANERTKKLVTVLLIFLLIIALVGGLIFSTLSFIETNNFRVVVMPESRNVLSLAHESTFGVPVSTLNLGGPKVMSDVTLDDFPLLFGTNDWFNLVTSTCGSFNEINPNINFMASTFHLRNHSETAVAYRERLSITDVTRGMDEAIRIMLVTTLNGNQTVEVFAKPRLNADGSLMKCPDGNPVPEHVVPRSYYSRLHLMELSDEQLLTAQTTYFTESRTWSLNEEDAWLAQPFQSGNNVVMRDHVLNANQTVTYTIFVWVEGWDSQATEEIINGTMRIQMEFMAV
jgi:hypothetical protein